MHDDDILLLTDSEKAIILDNFITRISGINRKSGQVIVGSYQILDMLEQIAIDVGYIECPTCHQKKKKVG